MLIRGWDGVAMGLLWQPHMNFKLVFNIYRVCFLGAANSMIWYGSNSLFFLFPTVPWKSIGNFELLSWSCIDFPRLLPPRPPFSFSVDAFCQTLVDTLENTPGLRYIWSTLKPFLQGKVLYTPDTPAARLLVKEVKSREKKKTVMSPAHWPLMHLRIA